MADLSPLGSIVSFGGTAISVASAGFPSIDRQPVEAYENILGNTLPVDLLNGAPSPRKDIFTCDVLVRADDSVTDPVTAWGLVASGYRALAGLPETGSLVVHSDASGSTSVSCTARRKPLPLTITSSNSRHLVVSLSFVLLTPWS